VISQAAVACQKFERKLVATSEIVNRIFAKECLRKALDGKPQRELWHKTLGQLLQFGNSSEGNHVELYRTGDDYFHALWTSFRHAEIEILFECYMLRNDKVSLRTVHELSAAALRGVKVRMVYDAVGASELPNEFKEQLRAAGVHLQEYNPVGLSALWRGPRSILFRNHKKTTIIDQKVAFVGGMNVTGEWCSVKIAGGEDKFRDTHARICGPAVDDIRNNFYETLLDMHPEPTDDDLVEEPRQMPRMESLCSRIYRIPRKIDTEAKTKRSIDRLKLHSRKLKEICSELPHSIKDLACDTTVGFANGTMVQVMQSWRQSNKRTIQNAMHSALQTSSRAVRITNPYFLPPPTMQRDILEAASRGVDVKILTCGHSDVPIMAWAARHLYQDLIGSGVRIFEYKKKVLHSKTMIVDDVFSTFGSFNFDDWSYRRNLEMNIVMMDPEMAGKLTEHFEEDLMDSEEVTLDCVANRGNMSRIWYFTCYQAARFPQRIEGLSSTRRDPSLSLNSLSYPKLSYPKPSVERPVMS